MGCDTDTSSWKWRDNWLARGILVAMDELSDARHRQKLDRYELLAEIASGGMATVYLGRLPGAGGFQRLVAIKRLHPHLEKEQGFIEMFLDEARIAARIHHPNVVSTIEIGSSPRGYFLVMDFVEGDTLARLLVKSTAAGRKIPRPIVLRIMHDSLAGLQAAHDLKDEDGKLLGLVHRDISPQNVLVGTDGTSRITDFGVARAASRLTFTQEGQLKGKLGYMSPEQAKGGDIDHRTDIFAAGVILWETLAGKRLFRGKNESDAETLHRIIYEVAPRLSTVDPTVPQELDELVVKALARDPAQRFQNCHEMLEAIERLPGEELRMCSTREVARFVEEIIGNEIAARREAIRGLAPLPDFPRGTDSGSISGAPIERTSRSIPKLRMSSMTPSSMALSDMGMPNSSTSLTLQGLPPPRGGVSGVLVGILVGASLAVLSVALFLLYSNRKTVQLPPPASSVVIIEMPSSASPLLPASPPPPTSALTTPSASVPSTVTPRPTSVGNTWHPKSKVDDLSSTPYR